MHRLLCFITLLSLFSLTACGSKVPFIGSDDDADATAESSAVPKESIEVQQFGPSQTTATTAPDAAAVSAGAETSSTTEVAPAEDIAAPSNTTANTTIAQREPARREPARREPPVEPLPKNIPIARQPSTASAPAAAAPAAAAPAAAPQAAANNQVASAPQPANQPAAISQRPKDVGCDAFEKICAQVVQDFIFRYRAGVVEGDVYGVVGYVAPKSEELRGKELDMTIMFAMFKGEGKANMPIPVKGVLDEPLRFERHFNVSEKPDLVLIESYTGRIVE